jgi:hypothetical protein
MRTLVLTLSLLAAFAFACNKTKNREPVDDQTRTTSAVIVAPTLQGHAVAEPDDNVMEMDGDEIDMSGPLDEARDGG